MERRYHNTHRIQTRWYVFLRHTAVDITIYLGRLIRVVLVTVICDKPAAHKIGGFASHSHNYFCTLCWIPAQDKAKVTSFQDGGESLEPYMLHHLSVCLP